MTNETTKPRLPFVIRRKFHADLREWELFAVFPTVAALSSEWYAMEAEAENGDTFPCHADYWQSSRHVRGIDPARVARFEERLRGKWEGDSDFPCVLWRRERKAAWMDAKRRDDWTRGRAA